jgi:exopolysaccharide biosynthesis polyprenyl glycosylphosphotransferase
MSVTTRAADAAEHRELRGRPFAPGAFAWISAYRRRAVVIDFGSALAAGAFAAHARFAQGDLPTECLALTCALPLLWCTAVVLAGGYDARFIGLGSDEFRRILGATVSLTATLALASYAAKLDLARGYLAVALPATGLLDLIARYLLRKRLHQLRRRGWCTQRVIAVGHAAAVADLVATLRRDSHHGLSVVAACVADPPEGGEIAQVPVAGPLDGAAAAVRRFGADVVAVLSCPEMDGTRLRELAWELEKAGTDLCVAPALLDVAGPRTTIRPVAGLPVLHVDHPDLAGSKRVLKGLFDRMLAAAALLLLAPVLAALVIVIRCTDPGPALFRQTRVGRAGRDFTVFKFRTMVVDAEDWKALLAERNQAHGVLFKMHRDPRVTRVGAVLRRWSLDEIPQLLNVLRGDMSLVGPRPALPEEAERYGHHMRRRLAVKPGITGLWQVSGRSDLSWDEAVRLDVRYVENWSFALDLQILWKTLSAVRHGSGAY